MKLRNTAVETVPRRRNNICRFHSLFAISRMRINQIVMLDTFNITKQITGYTFQIEVYIQRMLLVSTYQLKEAHELKTALYVATNTATHEHCLLHHIRHHRWAESSRTEKPPACFRLIAARQSLCFTATTPLSSGRINKLRTIPTVISAYSQKQRITMALTREQSLANIQVVEHAEY